MARSQTDSVPTVNLGDYFEDVTSTLSQRSQERDKQKGSKEKQEDA